MKSARSFLHLGLALTAASIAVASVAQAKGANKPETNAIAAEASPKQRVTFLEPKNGDKVSPKFKVKMGVDGYSIAPLGTMTKNTGHHHIIVDGGPVEMGTVVPTDKTHIHFGKGQTETELELAPGPHKLTLQFADGAHRSYGPGMSETISIEVLAK